MHYERNAMPECVVQWCRQVAAALGRASHVAIEMKIDIGINF